MARKTLADAKFQVGDKARILSIKELDSRLWGRKAVVIGRCVLTSNIIKYDVIVDSNSGDSESFRVSLEDALDIRESHLEAWNKGLKVGDYVVTVHGIGKITKIMTSGANYPYTVKQLASDHTDVYTIDELEPHDYEVPTGNEVSAALAEVTKEIEHTEARLAYLKTVQRVLQEKGN